MFKDTMRKTVEKVDRFLFETPLIVDRAVKTATTAGHMKETTESTQEKRPYDEAKKMEAAFEAFRTREGVAAEPYRFSSRRIEGKL